MSPVVVHEIPVVSRHLAGRCSQAYCFNVFVWFLLVVIPYIIGYATHGFWLKEDSFREQPNVQFKHQMMLMFQGSTPGTDYLWTTSSDLNDLAGDKVYPLEVTAHEEDSNNDGLSESLTIDVSVPLTEGQDITSIRALFVFDYQLSERIDLAMESLGYIDYQSVTPGSELFIRADLAMVQLNALGDKTDRTVYFTEELLSPSVITSYNDLKFSTILDSYVQRNETTKFENVYAVWTPGNTGALEGDVFTIKAEIRYPPQIIHYVPDFWQTMKFAWVQYLALFFIFYWIAKRFKNFVFENRIFETINDQKTKRQ